MTTDYGWLPRLLPEERHLYDQLQSTLDSLLRLLRQHKAEDLQLESAFAEELASAIRELHAAMVAAGIAAQKLGDTDAIAAWECRTPTEDRAKQLLRQGAESTPEWVCKVLQGSAGLDESRWRAIRQHIACLRDAILAAVAPVPPTAPEGRNRPLSRADTEALRDAIHALPFWLAYPPADDAERREVSVEWQTVDRLATHPIPIPGEDAAAWTLRLRLAAWEVYDAIYKGGSRPVEAIAHLQKCEHVLRVAPIGGDALPETLRPPAATRQSEGGVSKRKPGRAQRNPNQPSRDRQDDILAAIRAEGVPLTRPELIDAMKLKTEGKLGHHLAWLVEHGILVNISNRGYWPADKPAPE